MHPSISIHTLRLFQFASLVGGFKHEFLFSIVYGMSSFPLTNSYFARWLLHHQPDNYGQIHHFQWINPPFQLGHVPKIMVTLGFSLKIYRCSARLLQVWHPLGPTLSAQSASSLCAPTA